MLVCWSFFPVVLWLLSLVVGIEPMTLYILSMPLPLGYSSQFLISFHQRQEIGGKNHFIGKLKHLPGKVRELASPIAMLSLTSIFSCEEIVCIHRQMKKVI